MKPLARRLLVVSVVLAAFGFYSIHLGQDVNWDQRNYHVYNVYALLRGRLGYDVAPAGLQTFLPQLYMVPFVWLAREAPPRLTGFVLGVVHGVNTLLVFGITQKVLAAATPHRSLLAAIAVVVGMSAPATMSVLGTTFGDNIVSLLVLASLLLFVRSIDAHAPPSSWLAIGLLSGIAAGFKLSNAVYSLALVCTAGWVVVRRRCRGTVLLSLLAGMTLGFVLADGLWAWRLWQRYESPVFPLFNGIFRSPYWVAENFTDNRWTPASIWEGLGYPLAFLRLQARTLEQPFRDARWALLAVLGLVWCGQRLVRGAHGVPRPAPAADGVLAVFGLTAFVVWTFAFGYQRYLVPLELLSGALLLIGAHACLQSDRARLALVVAASIVVVATTHVPSWGRVPWGPSWFGVRVQGWVPRDAVVLLGHRHPLAYVIPFFPRSVRFVKLEVRGHVQRFGPALENEVETILHAHRGPLRMLVRGGVTDYEQTVLWRHGLEATGRCVRVHSQLDPDVVLCVVRHMAARSDAPNAAGPRTRGVAPSDG